VEDALGYYLNYSVGEIVAVNHLGSSKESDFEGHLHHQRGEWKVV
jgi:hypothetical protein